MGLSPDTIQTGWIGGEEETLVDDPQRSYTQRHTDTRETHRHVSIQDRLIYRHINTQDRHNSDTQMIEIHRNTKRHRDIETHRAHTEIHTDTYVTATEPLGLFPHTGDPRERDLANLMNWELEQACSVQISIL